MVCRKKPEHLTNPTPLLDAMGRFRMVLIDHGDKVRPFGVTYNAPCQPTSSAAWHTHGMQRAAERRRSFSWIGYLTACLRLVSSTAKRKLKLIGSY